MVTPAAFIIWASLVHASLAQSAITTNTPIATTTTTIVQGPTVSISTLLSQSSISTQFYQYWVASQVNGSLSANNQYTLFVPMNSAWNNLSTTDQGLLSTCLSSQCAQLQTVVKYHMWYGGYTTSTFSTGAAGKCVSSGATGVPSSKCLTYASQANSAQAHAILTQIGGNSWFINGARIVVSNQQAQNFIVHFIDRWLYPIDTSTSILQYLQTAPTTPTNPTSLVSQTCFLCSNVFSNLWLTVPTSTASVLYDWSQSKVAPITASITMFVPYAQLQGTAYSNSLASMIASVQSSSSNMTALNAIAAAHVIPNSILYLGPWIANGLNSVACGPVDWSGLNQYVQTCDLLQFNSTTYAIEVTGNGVTTGAFIIYPNIPIENGVVHIVSNFLEYQYGTLWSIVSVHPLLTKFKAYVQQDTTGVVMNYLNSNTNQYTAFVPDDASWSAVSTTITNNVTYLSTLLQLGIVPGAITFSSLQSMLTSVNTIAWNNNAGVAGNRLRFTSNLNVNGLEVDGGFLPTASAPNGFTQTIVSQPDLGGTNGIIHIVTGNAFGVPSMTIAQFLLSRPDLTASAMYFGQMTQAWSLFSNPGNPLTVIVPTNNAWTALQNGQNSVIVKSGQSALLFNLLLRHYGATNAQLYGSLQTTGATLNMATLNGQVTFSVASMSPPQYQVAYGGTTVIVNASDYSCTNGRVHIINSVLAVANDAYNLNAGYSCQNPYTCSSSAVFVNVTLLLLGVLFGLFGRR